MDSKMFEDSKDPYVQADVEELAKDSRIPWEQFYGKRILITGATGLIGSVLTKAIACHNRLFSSDIKIIATARNTEKANHTFKDILNRDYFTILKHDISTPLNYTIQCDYVIHAACETSSERFVKFPVETIWNILQGTKNVLDFAKNQMVTSMVYLSSLEYYGTTTHINVSENDLGYINPTAVRSSYSEGKRMAECMCTSYAIEYNVPIKTVRLAQTFGPGVSLTDNRVFAQFAKNAINGENIILHTKGETTRNYCYLADAVSGILTVLTKGSMGEAYNVANPRTSISIAEMAKFVCQNFGNKQSHVIYAVTDDVSKFGYNPTTKISLNTEKIEALGWFAKTDLYEMFERTIASLQLKHL